MNLVKSSLKYHQVTLSILLLAVAFGVYSLFTMPRREDPKITIRTGLVIGIYPGANSAQVEQQVTRKIEDVLFQYAEVRKEKTYSTSRDGMVIVNVELEQWVKDPDIFWAKLQQQLVLTQQTALPQGVKGVIVDADFGDTIAMLIALSSDSLDYAQLKVYQQKIADGLRTVNAVSKIKTYGERKEQIAVTSSSEKLAQYGIKLPQVVQVLQSQNSISPTGDIKTPDSKVPLYTKGYFNTETAIRNQLIGTSTTTGQVVKLGDVADVTREYADPDSKIRVNGRRTLLLSVEMQEGNNIVQFGEAVTRELDVLKTQLPSTLELGTIVNQPRIVRSSVNDFIREFFLAIVSVVVVTILLLPFRIAAVAAMAIPVTVSVTFALLHMIGIELHQVSLAALIVVLGMVVDDAIVIADNYVELLDQGTERWDAAWRSASELVIPVFTATFTIVASFMPMLILKGSVGEFISALPITVSIALASSFVVAMLLTPFLCYTFIKKGLHDPSASTTKKKRKSLLDYMQDGYDKAIVWCMAHKGVTLTVALLSMAASGLLFTQLKQKFFPAAERNQFVIELWMPTGTRLEKTDSAMMRIENHLKKDARVVSYARFSGTSAPRFYYNFSPEPPVTNYGQLLINTHNDKETEQLADELDGQVDAWVPEGRPHVRLMQQGDVMLAPVEVRIIGADIATLKRIGTEVQAIVEKAPGATLVRSDFHEDYYGVSIKLKPEANRLGFTTSNIATLVYTGFTGAPITTIWEGNNAVNMVLRLNAASRASFNDLQNTYVLSPATGASVPLRQIATLEPEWQSGRIMHRNGIPTLTISAEPRKGYLASGMLKEIQPSIGQLPLPAGYRIQYGGEYSNQQETFSQMVVALGISILLIFLILLFQFRDLTESLVVMASIPLSIFGALLGLIVTHNPFGFTAFIGLISLSGIVVRNAIILVDHTNELLRQGMDIPTAAVESGKRRLRPIFLTAMAAAIGVLPMIVSGSPLWSPLASVIAVGVVFSMVMALLVIPVLFVTFIKHKPLAESGQPPVTAAATV